MSHFLFLYPGVLSWRMHVGTLFVGRDLQETERRVLPQLSSWRSIDGKFTLGMRKLARRKNHFGVHCRAVAKGGRYVQLITKNL